MLIDIIVYYKGNVIQYPDTASYYECKICIVA